MRSPNPKQINTQNPNALNEQSKGNADTAAHTSNLRFP